MATTLGLDQLLYGFSLFDLLGTFLIPGPVGDFAVEIGSALSYFASRFTGRAPPEPTGRDLGQVFGVEGSSSEKGNQGGA